MRRGCMIQLTGGIRDTYHVTKGGAEAGGRPIGWCFWSRGRAIITLMYILFQGGGEKLSTGIQSHTWHMDVIGY